MIAVQHQHSNRAPVLLPGVVPGNLALVDTAGVVDQTWRQIMNEASEVVCREPHLQTWLDGSIRQHDTFQQALCHRMAEKLASTELPAALLLGIFTSAFDSEPSLADKEVADINAVIAEDPACAGPLQVFLYFKGFLALQTHRAAHVLWHTGQRQSAYLLQSLVSEKWAIDIHPAARVGTGLMLDHAHSIVIGETAVVGNNVTILHSVTLGGTGTPGADRHPKIGDGVVIGAGALVLGNITVGKNAKIAAGAVVVKDVPSNASAIGPAARLHGLS